ncbi:MAG: hypothetical protein HY348_04040 [Nitrospira defluvii]|nr:hypothetical protein [Nitrospira defluvii]
MPSPSDTRRRTASPFRTVEPRPGIHASGRKRSIRSHPLVVGLSLSVLFPAMVVSQSRPAAPLAVTPTAAQPARTPSPYIGSVMALLATFEDAGVLPPEGTPQANGIIKAAIQFQSAFLKSHHPAVQQFFAEAHRVKFGTRAVEVEASFRQSGWSADTFDAVIEAGQSANAWSETGLGDAFREFNIGKPDFDILAQLYQQSTAAFSTQGKTFQEVYAQRRREMPGAKSE